MARWLWSFPAVTTVKRRCMVAEGFLLSHVPCFRSSSLLFFLQFFFSPLFPMTFFSVGGFSSSDGLHHCRHLLPLPFSFGVASFRPNCSIFSLQLIQQRRQSLSPRPSPPSSPSSLFIHCASLHRRGFFFTATVGKWARRRTCER